MNILIAYGSTEGHTRKIATHISSVIAAAGSSAEIFDCGSVGKTPDPADFDAVIIAGSVHQEVHQATVVEFVTNNLDTLNAKPSAMISVSLSVSLENGVPEAERYVADFLKETGWKPGDTYLAGGAIRSLEYDFFQRFTVEHMVLKNKQMPGKNEGNPEYTDWDELDKFVKAFVKNAAG